MGLNLRAPVNIGFTGKENFYGIDYDGSRHRGSGGPAGTRHHCLPQKEKVCLIIGICSYRLLESRRVPGKE
jgi:hypothetical protein